MAYFDELLQRAITVRNNVAPSSNTALLVGGVLVSIVSALQLLLDTKQGTLTFDDEPTDGSTNPVTSDGIYEAIADAIASIDLSACEKIVNKVTALSAQSTDVQYPSAKCVYDALQAIDLSACEKIVNKVTSLSAQSTDTQYPSAKCVYDAIQAIDLSAYELIANKVTSLTAQATDTQYPSAKAVYDCCIVVQAALQSLDERVSRLELFHSFRIKGTSTNVGLTISIVVRTILDSNNKTISINVDNEGNWQYEYFGKMVVLQLTDSTIVTVDMTEADDFNAMTSLPIFSQSVEEIDMSNALFDNIVQAGARYNPWLTGSSLRKIDMRNASFANMTSAHCMFYNCSALEEIRLDNATFANLTSTGNLDQQNDNTQMFRCQNLTTLVLSKATFAKVKTAVMMFAYCYKLPSIDMPEATFERLQNASAMFAGCTALTSVNLDNATFDSLTNATNMFGSCTSLASINLGNASFDNLINAGSARYQGMFYGCSALVNVNLSNATFKSLTGAQGMFYGCSSLVSLDLGTATFEALTDAGTVNYNGSGMFSGCTSLATLNLTNATFESLQKNNQMFTACRALTNITNNTPGKFPLSLVLNAAPLNFTSMLTVANWLKDLTGQTAQSVTFKTSAWNALTAAEQSNIDAILTAKNWTRVLAA